MRRAAFRLAGSSPAASCGGRMGPLRRRNEVGPTPTRPRPGPSTTTRTGRPTPIPVPPAADSRIGRRDACRTTTCGTVFTPYHTVPPHNSLRGAETDHSISRVPTITFASTFAEQDGGCDPCRPFASVTPTSVCSFAFCRAIAALTPEKIDRFQCSPFLHTAQPTRAAET